LSGRFGAFVAERYPFAVERALNALDAVAHDAVHASDQIDALRGPLRQELRRRCSNLAPADLPEPTPGVAAAHRIEQAIDEIVDACDGFVRREAIARSLTPGERRDILRGMVLTRATDNRLKAFYLGSDVKYGGVAFQGKGFRSLGQEAIYAAAVRLRRGARYAAADGSWRGDIVSPMIRDLGIELAMGPERATIRGALSAQMGKALPPMYGKDLHRGDFAAGLLPAIAPLGSGALTIAGLALAFSLERSGRVAVALTGEGATSLGEWHEAINACAARRLPAIFCVQNNQTALSTPLADQSAVRVFADKAAGYGVPGITIDGTDPDAIAAAFTWAAERARDGAGPCLLELVSMRICGHAHHDDMLYLGREPQIAWEYPQPTGQGYVDRELYGYWASRDPIPTYAARLAADGLLGEGDLERFKREAETIVEEEAQQVIDAPWPEPSLAGVGVFAGEPPRRRRDPIGTRDEAGADAVLPPVDAGPPVDRQGQTFLDAVTLGLRDVLRGDPRAFIYGEDVGRTYGNAFLLLRPLLAEFGDRILNAPIAEGAVLGVCIGAALAGLRPIGEMQFNDFVATGFNQLVNSAAKTRYRWGASVPMVVRMPWGGLRHAGPFHSQNTEAWFYRTPGLKIVVPSTPADARALLASAVADPDPVLYYEHIALYRDPRIRQVLGEATPAPIPIGRAALRRAGSDLAIVSYGAFVHLASRVADALARDGIEASVLDLRSLVPLDRAALLAVARHCGRVLIVHEDSRTGGIGESLAAIIQEEAFEWLDAPIRIVGALDTPVPYSPPLEEFFLPSESEIETAARQLVRY
jgi:2-oxoisovalerate dehydrogenase E1 component